MPTPVQTRVAAAGRVGAFGLGGLEDFKRFFSRPELGAAHYEWRTLPITVKVIRALRDLATSHPAMPSLQTQDVAVQYGLTLGLSLAADLMDDPALVLPGMFGMKAEQSVDPIETFDEPQDIA